MKKALDNTELVVLNDHYNSTISDVRRFGLSRDRSFIVILILLGVMAFQYALPDNSNDVLTQAAQAWLKIDAAISVDIIGALIWFALLYVAVRYFQLVINIEKWYVYIHKLEVRLSENYHDESSFTRESKSYLINYAKFSQCVHIFYWYVFPLLLIFAALSKIIQEWLVGGGNFIVLVLNTFICAMLVGLTVLYVYSIILQKKKQEEKEEV